MDGFEHNCCTVIGSRSNHNKCTLNGLNSLLQPSVFPKESPGFPGPLLRDSKSTGEKKKIAFPSFLPSLHKHARSSFF